MKITIDITPEDVLSLLATQDEVGRNKTIAALAALAALEPVMTPEGNAQFKKDKDQAIREIFGLRTTRLSDEPQRRPKESFTNQPNLSMEAREKYEREFERDCEEIMGASLRTTRLPDEPPFCPDLD